MQVRWVVALSCHVQFAHQGSGGDPADTSTTLHSFRKRSLQHSVAFSKKNQARVIGSSSHDGGYEGELVQVLKMEALSCHVQFAQESGGEEGSEGGGGDDTAGIRKEHEQRTGRFH